MTDLEQLKQQLYAKIQPTASPSEIDSLKYSQLPEYEAHQRLKHQAEQRWKQATMQGAIPSSSPFAPADEQYLAEVLTECRAKLDSALVTAKRYPQLADLATALSDAITGIHEAAAIVIEPETYLQ